MRTGCSGPRRSLANAALAIDPDNGAIERIDTGRAAHWLAVSHADRESVRILQDLGFRRCHRSQEPQGRRPHHHPAAGGGLAVSPDGETVLVCAHQAPELYVIDARKDAIRKTVRIEGGEGKPNQLKRARISPDGRYVCVSSLLDNHAAIFETEGMRQIASIATAKGPMGFGFAADGTHAYLCCHDDAVVFEFELANGHVTRKFATAAGCEFIIAYQ